MKPGSIMMLKGKVNGKGKGKERGSKQSLLGGEGDKAVDDRKIKKNKDESPLWKIAYQWKSMEFQKRTLTAWH